MKKLCIFFLLSIIISVTAFGMIRGVDGSQNTDTAEYFRIHIRADDNSDEAQKVKYLVRDDIVAYLTPIAAESETKAEAEDKIRDRIQEVERVATNALRSRGYSYGARASIRKESFPTRVYDGYTLPAGEYSALIIELGSGKGDNWWCVVYPPLCFASPTGKNVVYRSKIAEIIRSWKEK